MRHLAEYAPFRVRWEGARGIVSWFRVPPEGFVAPFFEQTVRAALRRDPPLETPIKVLETLRVEGPPVQPAGFIFHCSRCGSTLAAQLLTRLSAHRVLSEAGPLEDIIADTQATLDEQVHWLRLIMGALAGPHGGQSPRIFVKWDAWHVFALPLIRRAFPDVPCLFLIRDPVEVLVSHGRMPGMHMLPAAIDPMRFGLPLEQVLLTPPLDYRAQLLGRILGEMETQLALTSKALLVDYGMLREKLFSHVLPHFGVSIDAAEERRLREAAGADAKSPGKRFTPDHAAKQAEADEELREAARRWAEESYRKLLQQTG